MTKTSEKEKTNYAWNPFCEYRYSIHQSVDQEIVDGIKREPDYLPIDNEEFLFTSPCSRETIFLNSCHGFFCITNKRIFIWQGHYVDLAEILTTYNIEELDIKSLTRFKLKRGRFFVKHLCVNGMFFNGNAPENKTFRKNKKMHIVITKYHNNFKLLKDALEKIGLILDDPRLNKK